MFVSVEILVLLSTLQMAGRIVLGWLLLIFNALVLSHSLSLSIQKSVLFINRTLRDMPVTSFVVFIVDVKINSYGAWLIPLNRWC